MTSSRCSVIDAEPHAEQRGGADAEHDRGSPPCWRQSGHDHADHHGVVAGERQVDQQHLHQGREFVQAGGVEHGFLAACRG